MKVSDSGGGDFEQPEAGSYGAICHKLIDIGTQTGEYEGKTTTKRQVIIGWELDEKMSDGNPFRVASFYTLSLNEKAKLRAHLEAWRGVGFTAEELAGFELKNVLGKPCMVSLTKNAKGKIKVNAVSKLPKGMAPHVLEGENVYFDLQDFDEAAFDNLSDGIKRMIVQSPEYQAIMAVRKGTPGAAPAADDTVSVEEVPF